MSEQGEQSQEQEQESEDQDQDQEQDQAAEKDTAKQEAASTEARAELVGWKPGGTKSAEEFLSLRDENLGIARADIKKLEGKLGTMSATMSAMAKHMGDKEKTDIKTGYNRGIAAEKAKMSKAAEDGDTDSYKTAERNVDALEKERDKKLDAHEDIAKPVSEASPIVAMVQAHQEANPELFATRDMSEDWIKEVQFQGGRNKTLTPDQVFAKADKIMIKKYALGRSLPGPDENTDTSIVKKDEGGDLKFSQLDKEEKAAYEEFKRDMPDYTKEKYMEVYNANR